MGENEIFFHPNRVFFSDASRMFVDHYPSIKFN